MIRSSLISLSLAALASLSMAGYAQQQPLPQSSASREAWCADNPEKCKEWKNRADGNPPDKAKRRGADRGPSNSVPNQRN